jgi:hypothetical protein
LLLLGLSACGGMPDLNKAGTRLGVVLGDLDPTLIGTFRLWDKRKPEKGMFTLLVLRSDLTFHGVYVSSCSEQPCTTIEIEGQYRQHRELPNPSRAARISLFFELFDEATAAPAAAYLVLQRGWVEGSPKIGLFHALEDDESGTPFFELSHPAELWCASSDDCEAQETENTCSGAFSCSESLCSCP